MPGREEKPTGPVTISVALAAGGSTGQPKGAPDATPALEAPNVSCCTSCWEVYKRKLDKCCAAFADGCGELAAFV